MKDTTYTKRYVARIVIEAKTPLAVSSGNKNVMTDSVVALDVNELPFIPGTSIAGIIRHTLPKEVAEEFFGYQKGDKDGHGSMLLFSEAKMIGEEGKVVDGMSSIDFDKSDFYKHFKELPIRQHARINHQGVTVKTGKFDEQVVFKGTRFCFEMEMVATDDEKYKTMFESVIGKLNSSSFRVGSGTRSGFGEIKVVSCQKKDYDLTKSEDRKSYINKSSSLAAPWEGDKYEFTNNSEQWDRYELSLTPTDFFMFGSGFGDEDVDMKPVEECYIKWNGNKPEFVKSSQVVLIPASSLKGALAHRVAYHYNDITGIKADELEPEDFKNYVGNKNKAVKALFGSEGEKDKDSKKMKDQQRGNILFSDIMEDKKKDNKIMNHVAIDRFTGGAIDGALFSEKVTDGRGEHYATTLLVNNDAIIDADIKEALNRALRDLCKGMLPLGGGVNRGNGTFTGSLKINGEDVKW